MSSPFNDKNAFRKQNIYFFQISAARTGACANIDATLLVERSKLIQTNLTEPYVEIHEGTGSSHKKFDAWPGPNINGMKMVTWFSSPSILYDVFQRFLFIFGRFDTFILTFFITQESV